MLSRVKLYVFDSSSNGVCRTDRIGAHMSEEVKLYDEADKHKAAGELEQAVAKLQAALRVNEQLRTRALCASGGVAKDGST